MSRALPPDPPFRYLPLKEQAGELRREVAALQKRVVSEELKVSWDVVSVVKVVSKLSMV